MKKKQIKFYRVMQLSASGDYYENMLVLSHAAFHKKFGDEVEDVRNGTHATWELTEEFEKEVTFLSVEEGEVKPEHVGTFSTSGFENLL